jgi:hypothetical protein
MSSPQRRKRFKKYILIFLIILVLILAALVFFFFHKTQTLQNTTASQQKETATLISEVGRIILLPTNETPTIATVSDPTLLKNQPFFVNATKGDKVLIYSSAKRAILYDPVQKKIINVASIDIGANQSGLPTNTPSDPTIKNSQ